VIVCPGTKYVISSRIGLNHVGRAYLRKNPRTGTDMEGNSFCGDNPLLLDDIPGSDILSSDTTRANHRRGSVFSLINVEQRV
jgi:hypothetical protein